MGQKNFDELNNAFNVNEKLFLAGNQRVDLLKSPINNFYKDAALKLKNNMEILFYIQLNLQKLIL